MKELKCLVFVFCAVCCLAGCGSDDVSAFIVPSAEGRMQDLDGNTYRWIRIDTLDWMAENLHAGTPWYQQSRFSPAGPDEACAQLYALFGNYYNYQEALDQCPDGWRMPTDDDWKSLERACGMSSSQVDRTGWRSGAARMLTGTESVNLRFGGELSAFNTIYVHDYHVYDYGLYWSQTIDPSQVDRCAFIRKITPALNEVQRISTPVSTRWLSVRYCRSAK